MTPATPPSWSRVKAILADALDLPTGERTPFLDRACAGEPGLRSRVDDLIRAYSRSSALDDRDSPARALRAPFEPGSGTRLGRYRLTRLIGRGGMGAVYEAVDEQLSRPVAVKILQAGLASRAVLRRFEQEPRLLARLRHPGIAQIFEAGSVGGPGGEPVPFFAMELIAGALPITAFAEANGLGVPDRILLLLKVCDAVTHGHQRSVIHRDLKPANILVDPAGQPKIIDFGVARATDPELTAGTIPGELLGTLRYMSPEQLSVGEADDVDVRADVYALGVVLYELLTGRPPQPDPEGGVLESIRSAAGRAPAPLSRLDPALGGDLETVALKAVEPDRAARYQSVAEFAADLRHILRHEPITARPHSAIYQIRKFARRHRALVAGIGAVFISLLLGIIGTSIGLVRAKAAEATARAQTRRSQRLAGFLENTIRSADPQLPPASVREALTPQTATWESWMFPPGGWGSAGPAEVGVAGVLSHAAEHIRAEFADDPPLLVDVSILFAQALSSLQGAASGEELLRSALQVQAGSLPAADPSLVRTRVMLAEILMNTDRHAEAQEQFELARAGAQEAFGPWDPRTLFIGDHIIRNRARLTGRLDDAIVEARRSIEATAAALGPDNPAVWVRHLEFIELLRSRERPEDRPSIISACRLALAGIERTMGAESPYLSQVCWSLATELQREASGLAEAEELERRALSMSEKFFGRDSSSAYDRRTALLGVLLRQRKLPEAESLARETLDSSLRMIGTRSGYTLKAQARLARVLTWREREPEEAERLARQAAEGSVSAFGVSDDFTCYHQAIWAAAIRLRGHPQQAEAILRDGIARRGPRKVQAESGWVEAFEHLQLALALRDEGRRDEAGQALATAREWADQLRDPSNPILLNILEAQATLQTPR